MRPAIFILVMLALFASLLAACGSQSPDAAATVTQYLNALAAKDANRLSTLSCAAWETQAQQQLDSFTSVDTKLTDLACKQTGTDGDKALVKCSGKLVASYNAENQEIDLSASTYVLSNANGAWLVCGQK